MSSSSDLQTTLAQHVIQRQRRQPSPTKPRKSAGKKKKSKQPPTIQLQHEPRNEGDDPNWAYKPPADAVRFDHAVDPGPFEWDALQDDSDTEVWVLRVPDSIQARHLQGLDIDVDVPTSRARTVRIGTLARKTTMYDVWSIGSPNADADADTDENENGDEDEDTANANANANAAAEELLSLTPLLPRKQNQGQLYMAPKPIARHILVAVRPCSATPHENTSYTRPPRASYPKSMLTHAFMPYGARSAQTQTQTLTEPEDTLMDVEAVTHEPVIQSPDARRKKPTSKGMKRKPDGESPTKKSKKHKVET